MHNGFRCLLKDYGKPLIIRVPVNQDINLDTGTVTSETNDIVINQALMVRGDVRGYTANFVEALKAAGHYDYSVYTFAFKVAVSEDKLVKARLLFNGEEYEFKQLYIDCGIYLIKAVRVI